MISTLVDLLANFYARNDYANFETIARSLLNTIPNDQVSLQFLGLAYYRTGRIKDATRIFDKVIRRRKPAKAETELGDADLSQGDYAAAACYQEATRHRPELAQAWYDLGTALMELGKYEQAIPAFRSSLMAQPESTQAILSLGRTALLVNDTLVAEENFACLRELQPNSVDAYHGLGQVYRKRRDFATARACFVRVRLLRGNHNSIDTLTSQRRSGRLSTRQASEILCHPRSITTVFEASLAKTAYRKSKDSRQSN